MEQARGGGAGFESERSFYSDLGARVRRARGQLPQQAVAEAVGLSRASVANIEAGRQPVSTWTLIRLAEVLAVRPTDLLPTGQTMQSDPELDLSGLDAAERRFVSAVSRRIEASDGETKTGT